MAKTKQRGGWKSSRRKSSGSKDAQAKTKPRKRAGTVALREIRKYQKSWNLLIPAAPFIRTIKEIYFIYAPAISRWTAEALVAMQEAAEDYIVQMFEEAMLCAIHAKRVTLSTMCLFFVLILVFLLCSEEGF